LQALAATAVVALIGGGLHQDGLADMADGFGGGQTTEDVLPRVVALAELVAHDVGWRWIIVAAVFSRCSICLGWLMPYARQAAGTGASITQFTGPMEVAGAVLFAIVVGTILAGANIGLVILLSAIWQSSQLPAGVTHRILLVRHGETAHSARGLCYGKLDVALSPTGFKQAAQTAQSIKSFKPHGFWGLRRLELRRG